MAASGATPIQLYHSSTPAAVPSAGNLIDGELAINIADGKLFYKDTGGVVKTVSGGIEYTTEKTSNYTATANQGVLTNTTGGAFTVTLPATPSNGDQVIVADAANFWGTNNLTVARNGSNIGGLAQDLTCDISGAQVQLVYNSAGTNGWEVYAQIGGAGGNAVTLNGVQTLTNKTISGANNTLTVDGTNPVGYINVPYVADKTAAYTLATGDRGKVVGVGSGGSIEIPDATFAAGDVVAVFNNTTSDVTITCTITTAYIGGTDVDVASVTLATRGIASILFVSGTVCVITGNVS